jgi:hypothetical protein
MLINVQWPSKLVFAICSNNRSVVKERARSKAKDVMGLGLKRTCISTPSQVEMRRLPRKSG